LPTTPSPGASWWPHGLTMAGGGDETKRFPEKPRTLKTGRRAPSWHDYRGAYTAAQQWRPATPHSTNEKMEAGTIMRCKPRKRFTSGGGTRAEGAEDRAAKIDSARRLSPLAFCTQPARIAPRYWLYRAPALAPPCALTPHRLRLRQQRRRESGSWAHTAAALALPHCASTCAILPFSTPSRLRTPPFALSLHRMRFISPTYHMPVSTALSHLPTFPAVVGGTKIKGSVHRRSCLSARSAVEPRVVSRLQSGQLG